jgi:hypothetical protein
MATRHPWYTEPGTEPADQVTQEQLGGMSPEEVSEALRAGKLNERLRQGKPTEE